MKEVRRVRGKRSKSFPREFWWSVAKWSVSVYPSKSAAKCDKSVPKDVKRIYPKQIMLESMNERLIKFLETNRNILVSEWERNLMFEWNSQVAADSLSGNRGSTRVTSQLSCTCAPQTQEMVKFLVNGFYDDLLSLLHGRTFSEMRPSEQRFPHYTPFGVRLTLSYLMEIFFAGEDVLAEHFLLNDTGNHIFATSIETFEACRDALHRLTEHYAEEFCRECLAPLNTTISRVVEGSKLCEQCKGGLYADETKS